MKQNRRLFGAKTIDFRLKIYQKQAKKHDFETFFHQKTPLFASKLLPNRRNNAVFDIKNVVFWPKSVPM
jgi:hypothetical protein